MAYTNDQRMAFVMQRAQGKSFDKIADDLGITKQTLIKWQGEMFAQNPCKVLDHYRIIACQN